MTHTKDEALKLALEALDDIAAYYPNSWASDTARTAITAIKQALAAQPAPVQEPVAWVREHELPLAPGDAFSWVETFVHKTPLYTTPPAAQRQWVGLTDEEHRVCTQSPFTAENYRAIEAKLREKNT
jgi:hypothetical protein